MTDLSIGQTKSLSTSDGSSVERVNLNPYVSVEERLGRHEVPVKKEFLKVLYADEMALKDTRPNKDDTPPKKKSRYSRAGKKERREKKREDLFQGKGLCFAIAKGNPCETNSSCKFSHDVDTYLSQKPTDISDKCILFDQWGYCPYGWTCRFANHHIKDGKLLVHEEKKAQTEANPPSIENTLPREIQQGLRKKKIPFTKSKEAISIHAPELMGFLKKVPNEPTDATNDSDNFIPLPAREKKTTIDWGNKLILAPLTTVGNLPFRRICKNFGVDVTVGEMALSTQLLSGSPQEWALVKRHRSEDIFGVQLAGSHPDAMAAAAELLSSKYNVDFIDINCGCPIDLVCNKGAGSHLLSRKTRLECICKTMSHVMDIPLTIKIRTGVQDKNPLAHTIVPLVKDWGVSAVTLHGRSKEQRYTKAADYEYMQKCAEASSVPFIFNGDAYSWQDAVKYREHNPAQSIMIARGALIKPWIFKEIKEQKDFDISGSERMDLIQDFVNYGLENWGSDQQGINNIRSFLLNWMSFTSRYVPVGIVEHLPTQINHRPPLFVGRDDKETLLSSSYVNDWIKISEMFLGPVTKDFSFTPKHKANSYPTLQGQ